MTAQMELDEDVMSDRLLAMLDALNNDDDEGAKKIASTIPLSVTLVKRMRHYMDKDDILELGYDMSLVEAELGKDWYDAP